MSLTRDDVQGWLDRWVEAWRAYDAAAIGALFAEDATYKYHPYDAEATVGREAIVAEGFLREARDTPSHDWTAHYEPYAVEGDRAVATGESRYTNPDGSLRDRFFNVWVLRFDDAGRCAAFVEYFMALPDDRNV